MTGSAQVIRANSRNLPLADDSVDLVCTSPPYFALRSYTDGGTHYQGQIGDEPTPAEFVESLLEVTRECVRVLKPSGSLWVNLGDKYSGAQQQSSGRESTMTSAEYWARTNPKTTGIKAKSLYGIPWRYALRCIDDLGLILRAEVIWSKPNGLPESVTDRVRRSHETWFHFVLKPRYFSAVDEIREDSWSGKSGSGARSTSRASAGFGPQDSHLLGTASSGSTVARCSHIALPTSSCPGPSPKDSNSTISVASDTASDTLSPSPFAPTSSAATLSPQPTSPRPTASTATSSMKPTPIDPRTGVVCAECACGHEIEPATTSSALGKLPGSVWTIPTEPLKVPDHLGVDHFAAFPTEWPKRIISGWSPAGVCVECGEGRRPVTNREASLRWPSGASELGVQSERADAKRLSLGAVTSTYTLAGYACACPEPTAPTTPAVVLDPFGGTGTTAMVAKALGRHGISVDMSADYCRLAEWRVNDRNQLAKVLGLEKTAAPDPEQLDLFGGDAA